MFAVVFTDIVDSTAIANQVGDERWVELLMRQFAQARRLMAEYDQHEVKIIGDSFMVVFRTAVEALDFVLAFHSETGDDSIKIRAGIHVGPARIINDDIYGMMVNYTKRVESQAEGPWIMISEEAKRHIDYEKAARHSKLLFGRPHHVLFKGFDRSQTIYRIAYPGRASEPRGARLMPVASEPVGKSNREPGITLRPRTKLKD